MYTFLERKFHKESIYIVRFMVKTCIFEKLQKMIFFGQKIFEQA